MSLELRIPDSVAEAIRLPEKRLADQLLVELAVALYAQEALSFGKARELAGMTMYEFGVLLGRRGVPRHYGREELEDDVTYASGQCYFSPSEPRHSRPACPPAPADGHRYDTYRCP